MMTILGADFKSHKISGAFDPLVFFAPIIDHPQLLTGYVHSELTRFFFHDSPAGARIPRHPSSSCRPVPGKKKGAQFRCRKKLAHNIS
jgi:hypothetical protein